jgi:hypothetical protein
MGLINFIFDTCSAYDTETKNKSVQYAFLLVRQVESMVLPVPVLVGREGELKH